MNFYFFLKKYNQNTINYTMTIVGKHLKISNYDSPLYFNTFEINIMLESSYEYFLHNFYN